MVEGKIGKAVGDYDQAELKRRLMLPEAVQGLDSGSATFLKDVLTRVLPISWASAVHNSIALARWLHHGSALLTVWLSHLAIPQSAAGVAPSQAEAEKRSKRPAWDTYNFEEFELAGGTSSTHKSKKLF